MLSGRGGGRGEEGIKVDKASGKRAWGGGVGSEG